MDSYLDQKIRLFSLIKRLSVFYGGDEIDFLHEYCEDVLARYDSDLKIAITCFEDMLLPLTPKAVQARAKVDS